MRQLLTALLVMLGCATVVPADVPRYRFEPGDWLVYTWQSTWRGPGPEAAVTRQTAQIQVWCLQRAGSEYLVLLDRIRVLPSGPEPIDGLLLWVDNRGNRRLVPETAHRAADFDHELDLLPILPAALANPRDWTAGPDHFGRLWHGASAPGSQPTHETMQVSMQPPPALAPLLRIERTGTLTFDRQSGRVVAGEITTTSAAGRVREDGFRLHQALQRNDVWRSHRDSELQAYLLKRRLENAMTVTATAPLMLPAVAERVPRIWDEYVRGFPAQTDSPFARLAAGRIRWLSGHAAQLREQAAPLTLWVGEPANTWTLAQADGAELRSEDLRTGVTVEWFYSAATPVSLYLAPQIVKLARSLPADVHVAAYNVDADPRRAGRTIAALRSAWPSNRVTHVFAAPLRESENLTTLPAVRVIDGAGVTRTATIGWTTDLYQLLEPVIGDWRRTERVREGLGYRQPTEATR
jgi:hypothetical protein